MIIFTTKPRIGCHEVMLLDYIKKNNKTQLSLAKLFNKRKNVLHLLQILHYSYFLDPPKKGR